MPDVVDAQTRSRMMAGIGGRNTKPELLVRRALHSRGLRFVLGGAGLPGRPDIVLPKWKVAVFVHGCFWHWHGCALSKLPSSNRDFWNQKLASNRDRDVEVMRILLTAGWRVATVWECALRGKVALQQLDRAMDTLSSWVMNSADGTLLELPVPAN